MRSLLALLALGLLGIAIAGCGSSHSTESAASAAGASTAATTHPDTTSPAAASPSSSHFSTPHPTQSQLEKYDRDEDDYLRLPDDNNPSPVGYATAAPADRLAVTALVRRYYAAALRGDGVGGCSLIDAGFVKAIPLDYGKLGPSYLRRAAGTCPAVMSLFFKHEHPLLAREVPAMSIARVSVSGKQGIAFLRFGPLHERLISVLREGSSWRIAAVLDGELN